jgi:hypothetical protein
MAGTMASPFDCTGIETGPDGVRRYTGLPQNLVQVLRAAVDRAPDAPAVAELGGERLTYRQLWDRATRVAGGLRAAGVAPGNRVANRLPNGTDWVLVFWGTLLAGAVVVPVNTRFAPPEVQYVVEDSGAAFVAEPGAPVPDGEPLEVTGQGHTDLAGIVYTSGTTGFPKGAMTTHENFLSNVETCLRVMALGREQPQTTLISVPLFHVTGCNSQLLVVTALAGTPWSCRRSRSAPSCGPSRRSASPWRSASRRLLARPAAARLRGRRHLLGAGGDLRRGADRPRPGAPHPVGVPHGAGRQRLRAHRDLVRRHLPAARVRRRARRLRRLRPRRSSTWRCEPDPATGVGELLIRGPERGRRLLGKPGADARRPSSTAGCTAATSPASTRPGWCTSSTARRT